MMITDNRLFCLPSYVDWAGCPNLKDMRPIVETLAIRDTGGFEGPSKIDSV